MLGGICGRNDWVADIGGRQWCGCLSDVQGQCPLEQGHSPKVGESDFASEQSETSYVLEQRLLQILW